MVFRDHPEDHCFNMPYLLWRSDQLLIELDEILFVIFFQDRLDLIFQFFQIEIGRDHRGEAFSFFLEDLRKQLSVVPLVGISQIDSQ